MQIMTAATPRLRCMPAEPSIPLEARPNVPLPPSPVGVPDSLRQETIQLTQDLVRINSGPERLVPGEQEVVARLVNFAKENGLASHTLETVNGKPVLVVTLAGSNPQLGTVGFVHHSDVVEPEGEWKLGQPYSGNLTHDEQGREIIVGRGTVDTKGPIAQILVAMKHLKETGQTPQRSIKLFVFPDEETGGKDGAYYIAKHSPELIKDVQYWVVEGSGVLDPTFVGGAYKNQDVAYLAVAQKYMIPLQMELKQPGNPQEVIHRTFERLDRVDEMIEKRPWSFLGDAKETKESMRRLGNTIGGYKGFLIRHFYDWGFMQKKMGVGNAVTNRTDYCKTDFYLSNNASGHKEGFNVKPSSASAVFQFDLNADDRQKALDLARKATAEGTRLEELPDGKVRLTLPQENYHGGNHGSTANRALDAVDVTHRSLDKIEKAMRANGLGDKVKLVDFYTAKSPSGSAPADAVTSKVTLDLRLTTEDNPKEFISQLQNVVGPDFSLTQVLGPEQLEDHVRRLKHTSPLFQAAEQSVQKVYGPKMPILMGNTTGSNDTRFLMNANPQSETLTFTPISYTSHGPHGPDEAVTTHSLLMGLDYTVDFMQRLGGRKN